jgi:hypothetical protein
MYGGNKRDAPQTITTQKHATQGYAEVTTQLQHNTKEKAQGTAPNDKGAGY